MSSQHPQCNRLDFLNLFNSISDFYDKPRLNKSSLEFYFEDLCCYTIDQIKWAFSRHRRDPDKGRFMPRTSDLLSRLTGGEFDFSSDEIIAMANLKNTPIGILCRIHIGTYDLGATHANPRYLTMRAEECKALMQGWAARSLRGEYSNHEISIMRKHGVDPCGPVATGYPGANNPELPKRVAEIEKTPRHLYLIQPPEEAPEDKNIVPHESIRKRLMEIVDD